ncbi:hypothetical protein NE237_032022 [Protea cynaroides]|uniref:Uncharacterized protein n=1 Tax=Protea cynaroides TaxID=273540 RepID=A0A9Q0L2M3_9MAGN|nr:hypothetical protein NE237_032022 [Protea cynaroides]
MRQMPRRGRFKTKAQHLEQTKPSRLTLATRPFSLGRAEANAKEGRAISPDPGYLDISPRMSRSKMTRRVDSRPRLNTLNRLNYLANPDCSTFSLGKLQQNAKEGRFKTKARHLRQAEPSRQTLASRTFPLGQAEVNVKEGRFKTEAQHLGQAKPSHQTLAARPFPLEQAEENAKGRLKTEAQYLR